MDGDLVTHLWLNFRNSNRTGANCKMLKKTTSDEKKAKYLLLLLLSNHQTLSKIHTIHESFKSWSTNYAIVLSCKMYVMAITPWALLIMNLKEGMQSDKIHLIKINYIKWKKYINPSSLTVHTHAPTVISVQKPSLWPRINFWFTLF